MQGLYAQINEAKRQQEESGNRCRWEIRDRVQEEEGGGITHGFQRVEGHPEIWAKTLKLDLFRDINIGGIICDSLTCGMYSLCCAGSAASAPNPDSLVAVAFNDKLKELGVKEPRKEIVTYDYASIVPKVEMKHSGLTVNDQPRFNFMIRTQEGSTILIGSDFSFTPGLHLQAYAAFVGARLKGEEELGSKDDNNDATAPENPTFTLCIACKASLPLNSAFCNKCGKPQGPAAVE